MVDSQAAASLGSIVIGNGHDLNNGVMKAILRFRVVVVVHTRVVHLTGCNLRPVYMIHQRTLEILVAISVSKHNSMIYLVNMRGWELSHSHLPTGLDSLLPGHNVVAFVALTVIVAGVRVNDVDTSQGASGQELSPVARCNCYVSICQQLFHVIFHNL